METLLVYSADANLIRMVNEAFWRLCVVRDVAEERWACAILGSEAVAAVVIDCALGDATALCARIRQRCFQPLLAITPGVAPETRAALLQAGADGVLLRPLASAALRLAVFPWLQAQPFGAHCPTNRGALPVRGVGTHMPLNGAQCAATQTHRRAVRLARASLDA